MSSEALKDAIEQAIKGDKDAFEILFNTFWGMAYYFCLKYLRNEQEAQDATQDAFVLLFKRIRTLEHPEAFKRNFQYILLETCRNHSKKKQKPYSAHKALDLDEMTDHLAEEKVEFLPMEALERQDLQEKLLQLVNDLPKQQREVVMLYYFNEMPQAEIADALDMKPSSVRSYLRNARNSLKAKIEKLTKEKGVHVMSATPPILTRILFDDMQKFATNELRDEIWKSTHERILALETELSSNDTSADATSKPNNAITGTVICCIVCASVFVTSMGMYLRPRENPLPLPIEAVAMQSDEVLEALWHIYDLDGFNRFVHRYLFENLRYFVREGRIQYSIYVKNLYDMTIFAGYRTDGTNFQLAYELAPYGASGPEDVEHWVRTHLR